MGINKLLLGAALIATLVAVPVSNSIKGLQDSLDIERLEKAQLELKIEKKETQAEKLEKKIEEIKSDKEKTNKEKDAEIEKLKRDLLAKHEREEKERLRLVATAQAASVSQPDPTPAPQANVAGSGSCAAEIAKYNWNQTVAVNVSRAESGLRNDARGDTHLTYYQDGVRYGDSWGCFQIRFLPGRPSPSQLTNAAFNVKYAYDMYLSQNWMPWSVCHHTVNCY